MVGCVSLSCYLPKKRQRDSAMSLFSNFAMLLLAFWNQSSYSEFQCMVDFGIEFLWAYVVADVDCFTLQWLDIGFGDKTKQQKSY